jgi:hypothetical protein
MIQGDSKMKKAAITTMVVVALTAALFGGASHATAVPTKQKACSSCHKTSSAVTVALTRKAATSSAVTYSVKIKGGKGATGWAVLSGGRNIAHGRATSGTFTVGNGHTFKVWAVKKGTGSTSRAATAK